jgi:hypothetical protein
MKLAAFDIEIATEIPEEVTDWQDIEPLGISCAAVALSDSDQVRFWQGVPRMTRQACQDMVRELERLVQQGYTLLTWNGCKFDFSVLAQESGLENECAKMAMDHVDLMLIVTFKQGYFLGLEKALLGAGLEGKLKRVALSDGTVMDDMDGAKAPQLWAAGEHEAVLAYLNEDVVRLLGLAQFIQDTKTIRWTSNRGRPQTLFVERLFTVREAFDLPEPDVSWLSNPPRRGDFIRWMPK